MTKSIAIAVVCCLAALVGVDRTALAQAGSTGGTLGKTDKSASGGEENKLDSRPRRPAPSASQSLSDVRGLCSHVVGNWAFNNFVAVTFRPDRTAVATNGDHGTWSCNSGTVTMDWQRWTDRYKLSSDGISITGISGVDGATLTASKR
jgi:hypothetical protein